MLPLGTKAPGFTLPSTEGNSVSLSDYADSKALLIIFMCNHCPYVKHVADQLKQLADDYADQGVAVVGISSNDAEKYPDDSPAAMAEEKAMRDIHLHICMMKIRVWLKLIALPALDLSLTRSISWLTEDS